MTVPYRVTRCGVDCPCASAPLIEPASTPADESMWSGIDFGAVEIEPVRDPAVAYHEAAHAVAFHGFGVNVDAIVLDGQGVVKPGERLRSHPVRAAIYLAGPVGQGWFSRAVHRPYDEVATFIRAVRDLRFGSCDRCQAVLSVFGEMKSSASDETILRRYREIEQRTINVIQRHDVWRAVRDIASELMGHGNIDGDHAHTLAERHVKFSSLTI